MKPALAASSLALAAWLGAGPAAADSAIDSGLATAGAESAAAKPSAVPFVDDDYGRALRDARAAGRPLFVEAWAPW